MTLIYGLAIAIGAGGVLLTVGLAMNSERPSLPAQARHVLLAVLGFGLAGMASSFGGWPSELALLAALGGGALLVALGIRYGPALGEE